MALRFATCGSMFLWLGLATSASLLLLAGLAAAAPPAGGRWVVSWVGSAHGPYPAGNASAQPDLERVFPTAAAGARDQSFRLIVRPEIWGCQARLRFCNAFGSQPVTFADVHVGLQQAGSAVVRRHQPPGRVRRQAPRVTVAPGRSAWSDPGRPALRLRRGRRPLAGRKLAVSFHVPGESGPMTWHAKALQTSYLTAPAGGLARAPRRARRPFPSARPPGSSSTPST